MGNYLLAFTIGWCCALTYAAWSASKKIFSKYHLIPKQNFMVKAPKAPLRWLLLR